MLSNNRTWFSPAFLEQREGDPSVIEAGFVGEESCTGGLEEKSPDAACMGDDGCGEPMRDDA